MVFPVHRAMVARVVATVCAVAGCVLLMSVPAQALVTHQYLSSFGVFGNVQSIAVDEATGDVYIYDATAGIVYKFDAAGEAAEFSALKTDAIEGVGGGVPVEGVVSGQIAVDNSSGPAKGDIYAANGSNVQIYSPSGTAIGELNSEVAGPWQSPIGVAVDAAGRVFVGLANNELGTRYVLAKNYVSMYTPSANPVTNGDYASSIKVEDAPCGVATNAQGDIIYVADSCSHALRFVAVKTYEFPQGVRVGELAEGVTALAIDPSNTGAYAQDLYADLGREVAQFSPSGSLVSAFGSSGGGAIGEGSSGVAVDGASGDVYVSDSATGQVSAFGPTVVVPDVTTGSMSPSPTQGSVTLNGTVNPQGEQVTSCQFEYGPEEAYGSIAPCEPTSPSGTSPVAVTAHLSGLTPGALYHYRLVAGDEHGTNPGADMTFSVPMRPVIAEESVLDATSTSVTLQAQIELGAPEAEYWFEYGTGSSYGLRIPLPAGALSGSSAVSVSARVQGLQPGTVYHYRVVAANLIGEQPGADQIFTTQTTGVEFGLPDGRAWELVSPPDKEGAEVETYRFGLGGDMQAAEDGEAVTYVTNAPVGADQVSNPIETQVFSRRVGDSWVSEDIATPHRKASQLEWRERGAGEGVPVRLTELGEYEAFSPDLSLAYVEPEGRTPLAPPAPAPKLGSPGGYVRDDGTDVFGRTELSAWEWYAEQVALAQGPPRCDASSSPAKGEGVDAVSSDGCYVYFNSEATLAPGATGANPLYVAHEEGGEWKTTFISSLSGIEDAVPWGSLAGFELSPNGRYAAFMSTLNLTGYDNRDAVTGQPDEEVYLYDADANRLVCASCDPTGARPVGQLDVGVDENPYEDALLVDRAASWEGQRLAGVLAAPLLRSQAALEEHAVVRQPRYLSDGGRLFFDSPVGLVSQDVNGSEDVYEYEPQGEGSCESSPGCLALISSGRSGGESALVEASANGSDVFFLTSGQLVGQDYDNVYDMYDAHVCSPSVPCPAPSVALPPPCTTGDACKPGPSPQPTVFGAPPSATFSGAGNSVRVVSKPAMKKRPKKRVVRKHRKKAKREQRRSK